ncbi:hypothetical protein EFA69_17445 [Rufibacter immobilis]|uniref:Uncharacterized protein n=1 Tax=Rufibacter immobilis TaxID=1348778 RepID=A0A3M9MT25_9BACT|nr:hypothetical protein [Rufibacter immobilis]RNI27878.1 hypothetical protein EFA69_17445 [Rufibacter immobilis]
MEEFSMIGENGNYLKVKFQEVYGFPESTCHWGGYELRAAVDMKSGSFTANSTFWTSTGELYEFYKKLEACNEEVKGSADFANYEDNLKFTINYNNLGQVNITGNFNTFSDLENELTFEFNSDQSYLKKTVGELKQIAGKYGNMKGVKK